MTNFVPIDLITIQDGKRRFSFQLSLPAVYDNDLVRIAYTAKGLECSSLIVYIN